MRRAAGEPPPIDALPPTTTGWPPASEPADRGAPSPPTALDDPLPAPPPQPPRAVQPSARRGLFKAAPLPEKDYLNAAA